MVKNTNKVSQKQWQKWNAQQQALFNGVYKDIMQIGFDLFLHPVTVQRKLSDKEFRTIAWNAAFTAATMLKNSFTDEIHTLYKGEVIAVDRIPRRAA
jgi:ClpP class serine protease